MFANVQEYYHATSLRDALKKLGKNEQQIPVPVTGAFHLISSKLRAATCLVDVSAVGLAFVNRWIAVAIYMVVAIMWLVPDRRLERPRVTD